MPGSQKGASALHVGEQISCLFMEQIFRKMPVLEYLVLCPFDV